MVISGIIRPPPDIRAVADRTALFVSKNGRAFEIKILNSEKGKTPKFAFLHETSPFHAYYEDRIRFHEEGGTDEDEQKKKEEEEERLRLQKEKEEEERAEKEREAAASQKKREAARKKASAVDPVARALLGCRSKISDARRRGGTSEVDSGTTTEETNGEHAGEQTDAAYHSGARPPPSLRHVNLVAPTNLTPLEIEVIKLTAQYVALSEKGGGVASGSRDNFLSNLTLREWTNPEFLFLQPRHAHFAYFTALVDGYRRFLPGGDEFIKMELQSKDKSLKNGDQNAEIDSKHNHDGVSECLESAAYRAEYERDAAERRREAAERAGGGGMLGGAGIIDWHDFVVVETIDFAADEVVEALPPPTTLRLAALTNEVPSKVEEEPAASAAVEEGAKSEQSVSEDDVDMEDDDDESEELKVVSNYQPKVVSTKEITGDSSRTHIIDPITGKSVPISDMPEHMRIQLLDPKWAQEKRRFLEKQRETNFVAGEDIASNISRLAQARGDIFGSSEAENKDQTADSEKRLMEANRIIREQAIQPQPQIQLQVPGPSSSFPHPVVQTSQLPLPPPPGVAAPLPGTTLAPLLPPPPAQQHVLAQTSLDTPATDEPSEEPAAKRIKVDEPLTNTSNPPVVPIPAAPLQPFDVTDTIPAAQVLPLPPQQTQPEILPEDDFIATLPNPDAVPITIQIPDDPSNANWNFNGQTIEFTLAATSKIKQVKEKLVGELGGMPLNKMQLKHPVTGFMNKDGLSLGYFNVGPGVVIDLVPKIRGGRK
mmetsp:Transcript_23564/g.47673  ORF Transcript_23564/g.47673 Transcript_23564/m.47673 type:complete len:768 (-) Transcript_23564:77-2380(-)